MVAISRNIQLTTYSLPTHYIQCLIATLYDWSSLPR